jgi:hypothetical protein
MVNGIEEQMVIFPFEFNAPTEIEIEESGKGTAIIRGIMLREGVSTNGNIYTIPEMKSIAVQAEGMPIYVGTATKFDPNVGVRRNNMHANFDENKIGKIISAIFDPIKRVVRYVAEIFNTATHPRVIEEVKAGWGVSIAGTANAQVVIDKSRKVLYRITGMIFKSLQLLAPKVKLGQDEARISDVEIQETMIIDEVVTNPIQRYKITIETNSIDNVNVSF